MSSHGSPSLEIEPNAGSQYSVIGAVLAILLIVPWWLSRLSSTGAALLTIGSLSVACLCFWRIGWLGGRHRLRKVLWTSNGEWRIFGQAKESWLATLHPSSQVMGSLLWLRFVSERGTSQLLLIGAGLTPDKRRLVTRLRLQASAQANDPMSDQRRSNAGDLP